MLILTLSGGYSYICCISFGNVLKKYFLKIMKKGHSHITTITPLAESLKKKYVYILFSITPLPITVLVYVSIWVF